MALILALDQGTSSSRSIVFDEQGQILASAQQEIRQHYPQPGWVEHDPLELWGSQRDTAAAALTQLAAQGRDLRELRAIGISAPLVAIIRQNRMYPSIAVFKTRVKAQANAAGIANANNAVDAVAADPRIVLNGP